MYCSIEEAWNQSPNISCHSGSSIDSVHDTIKPEDFMYNLKEQVVGCESALKHIESCKKCKSLLINRIREHLKKTEPQKSVTEHFNFDKQSYAVSDIIILVIVGIFIILALDVFVKLGTHFKK